MTWVFSVKSLDENLKYMINSVMFFFSPWISADARLLEEATEPICQKLGKWRHALNYKLNYPS